MVKRLARGDQEINPLYDACRDCDIAYYQNQCHSDRHKADRYYKTESGKESNQVALAQVTRQLLGQ